MSQSTAWRTVFITGTGTGLGKFTTLHFANLGWNVAATLLTPEKEPELTQYDTVKLFKLDVTDVEQVKTATDQAIAEFGRIDVVVNMPEWGAMARWNLPGRKPSTGNFRSMFGGQSMRFVLFSPFPGQRRWPVYQH